MNNEPEVNFNKGYTSSTTPVVTNGANDYMAGKIVDSSHNNETGKMVTPGDKTGGPEAEPNDDVEPLAPNSESDTATYGDSE